jgi:hypothetical protein
LVLLVVLLELLLLLHHGQLLLLRLRNLSGATSGFGASLWLGYFEAAHVFAQRFYLDVSLASCTGGDLFSLVIGINIPRAVI